MNISRSVSLAWLASAGLSPENQRLLLSLESDPIRLLDRWSKDEAFRKSAHLQEHLSKGLSFNLSESFLENLDSTMKLHQISVLCFLDDIYPARLRMLPEAPSVLFFQGNLTALKRRTVSMVGSRSASYKGLEATRRISEDLSASGISVISGLAYGIDAAAHQGCLKGGSPTIAVLGCGLDQDYPAENAALRHKLLDQGGLLISEYIPGEKPLGWHFPFRNRIISGLGDCLIVMEARIRSGSMTTVAHALNQGKDVFVYPGDPESKKSDGNHQLLREGAIYFTTAKDLMEDMHWLDKLEDVRQNSDCAVPKEGPELSEAERKVLSQLEQGEQGFDQLCSELNFPASQLNAVLSLLQIRGFINALPGKVFSRNTEV